MLLTGPFSRRAALAVGVALTLTLSGLIWCGGALAQSARKAPSAKDAGTCQRCHSAGLPVLGGHAKVKGELLAECGSCHAFQVGQAKADAFVTKLHRAHALASLDCSACHAFTPGKRLATTSGKSSLGAVDVDQLERLRKATQTWASGDFLAASHGAKNLSCGACHGKQLIPDDNETIVNRQCRSCHGGYDKMAALSKAKLKNPNINPHESHLGPQVACTACHQGHQASTSYCLHCHTNFDMPIPGAAKASAPGAAK